MSELKGLNPEEEDKLYLQLQKAIFGLLEEFGPLTVEAIAYFLNKRKFSKNITGAEVKWVVYGANKIFSLPSRENTEGTLRLVSLPDAESKIPSFSQEGYAAAYYELYEKMKFFKANPELINLPEKWVEKALNS